MPKKTKLKIKDLPKDQSLGGVRFVYPFDGEKYYWHSQWSKGVFGKKRLSDDRIYPLFVEKLEDALEWELA